MASFDVENGESERRRELFLAGAALLVAGLLLVLPVQYQQAISTALRSSVLAPFLGVQESIRQTRIRVSEVEELQARLDSTSALLASQRTLVLENLELRGLLDLRERTGPSFVPASLIRPGTRGSESMFLLDVGSDDGVRPNDPVVASDGLIGMIREVGPGTARAMDWSHPDFRVSVMTLDGEASGIVEPRRGAFREEDRLLLDGIPFNTVIESDEPLITSGIGSVFPRGIRVGRVLSLAEAEAGWRRGYWVEPAVRPGSAIHVLVITAEEGEPVQDLTHLWSDAPVPDSLSPSVIDEGGEAGDPVPPDSLPPPDSLLPPDSSGPDGSSEAAGDA